MKYSCPLNNTDLDCVGHLKKCACKWTLEFKLHCSRVNCITAAFRAPLILGGGKQHFGHARSRPQVSWRVPLTSGVWSGWRGHFWTRRRSRIPSGLFHLTVTSLASALGQVISPLWASVFPSSKAKFTGSLGRAEVPLAESGVA